MQMLFQADIGRQTPDEVQRHLLEGRRPRRARSARVCRRPFPRRHGSTGRNRRAHRRPLRALAPRTHARRRSQSAAHGRRRDASASNPRRFPSSSTRRSKSAAATAPPSPSTSSTASSTPSPAASSQANTERLQRVFGNQLCNKGTALAGPKSEAKRWVLTPEGCSVEQTGPLSNAHHRSCYS